MQCRACSGHAGMQAPDGRGCFLAFCDYFWSTFLCLGVRRLFCALCHEAATGSLLSPAPHARPPTETPRAHIASQSLRDVACEEVASPSPLRTPWQPQRPRATERARDASHATTAHEVAPSAPLRRRCAPARRAPRSVEELAGCGSHLLLHRAKSRHEAAARRRKRSTAGREHGRDNSKTRRRSCRPPKPARRSLPSPRETPTPGGFVSHSVDFRILVA